MSVSILSGILAFVMWCLTDTSLKPEHACDSEGKIISSWMLLWLVLVQIVLWVLVGYFAFWIVPHLPHFLLAGWRLPITALTSGFCQWFALFMILQYVWTIVSATAKTAVVAAMAAKKSRWAVRSLDEAPCRVMEMERKVGANQTTTKKGNLS